jgi:hypothetical protein
MSITAVASAAGGWLQAKPYKKGAKEGMEGAKCVGQGCIGENGIVVLIDTGD